VTVYLPDAAIGITAYDRLILPDGKTYEIQGSPAQNSSPFSGITSYIEARGRLVTGASV
jgi:hypothetical protein